MVKHFTRHAVLALCTAAFAACSPFGEEAGGSAEVTVHVVPDGLVQSRSSFTWADDMIRDIQVVVTTEDGTIHDVLYSDSPSSLQFTGTAGCLYRLWVAANIGGKVEVGTLEDFTEGTRHVSQAAIAASGIPMYSDGCYDIVVAAGENHASIPLKRMMARVDFSIDTHLLDYPESFSVSSVRICSPVDIFTPFAGPVAKEHSGEPDYDFDIASAMDISRLNSGGTIRLYTFENMQGTLLPGNTDPWEKVPSSIGGAGPYCTYLEVVCDYETDSETGCGITYHMYLGEDATTNFDVRRNTVYRLTLEPTEDEIRGNRGSWKIEPGEWDDTVEAELILTPSYLEIVKGETGRVSSAFHLTWPDGRTEYQPTICDWNVVGMGYLHVSFRSWQSFVDEVEIYGKSPGSAVISATASYGYHTYTAEMTVMVKEDIQEPIYTTEYEYELAVSPVSVTLAEGETAEFQAVYVTREYLLADGVRVSDTPASVTEDDVTEIAFWSVKSGLGYVTDEGRGIYTWASGPGSATVEVSFNGCADTAVITTLAHEVIYSSEYEYELVVNPVSVTLAEGETAEFEAVYITREYTLADGVRVSDTPASVTEDEVTEIAYWSVKSGARYVTDEGRGRFAWALGPGSTIIEASLNDCSDTAAINTLAHDIVYTSDYEYELMVSPASATLAEGETAEFEAVYITREYILADGVRVSDTPVSVTEDEVTEIAYWSVKSGARYVTDEGQGAFSWAEGPGSATIEASFNGCSDMATINTLAHYIVYTSEYEYELTISPASATLAEGETAEFEAVYTTREYILADGVRVSDTPASVTEDEVTEIAFWSVKNGSEYVKDEGRGLFSWASGPGSATIEASFNGCADTAVITTLAHEVIYSSEYEYELAVSPKSITLAEDETAHFDALYITREYTLADGIRISDEPSFVTEEDVTKIAFWSVQNGHGYVICKGEGNFDWASGPGSATVEASFNGCADTALITTLAHEVIYSSEYEYELVITPASVTLAEGETAEFQAVYITREYLLADGVRVSDTPTSITEDDVTDTAGWSVTSGAEYVTNEGHGVFGWMSGPGTATVTATFEGNSDTATITCEVHIPVIEYRYEYDIAPDESEIIVGETESYIVTRYTFTIIDGVQQPGYSTDTVPSVDLVWSSSAPSVATVSEGTATGRGYGTAVITATIDQDHTVSATLYVKLPEHEDPIVESIEIVELTGNGFLIFEPCLYHFACIVKMSDGTVYDSSDPAWTEDFTWTSPQNGRGINCNGDGWYEVTGDGPAEYVVGCAYETQIAHEYTSVTIIQSAISFEYNHSEGGRDYFSSEKERLHVKVYVNVKHGSETAEVRVIDFTDANEAVTLGDLSIYVTFDVMEGNLWTGCDGIVPEGAAARYYVHYQYGGTGGWYTDGPNSL